MSLINKKIIIYNNLFKITKELDKDLYKACNEEGCMTIVVPSNIKEFYIGEADPEFYFNAKVLKESAINLKSNVDKIGLCLDEDFCKKVDDIISLSEEIMKKFKY